MWKRHQIISYQNSQLENTSSLLTVTIINRKKVYKVTELSWENTVKCYNHILNTTDVIFM